jgi:hypothetical protein
MNPSDIISLAFGIGTVFLAFAPITAWIRHWAHKIWPPGNREVLESTKSLQKELKEHDTGIRCICQTLCEHVDKIHKTISAAKELDADNLQLQNDATKIRDRVTEETDRVLQAITVLQRDVRTTRMGMRQRRR